MAFNFNFTQQQLAQLIPGNPYVAQWYSALNMILPDYGIDTVPRVAAFVAQCAHESANFKFLKENLNYKAESLMRVWPSRFPNMDVARQYAMQPEKIANKVYSDRMGNGPESSGDGWRYAGKGLIQLTGRDNYTRFAESIETPVEEIPDYLGTFEGAVQSACWFWEVNNLNQWADAGDILTLTKRINGGVIGLEDRKKHYAHALHVLGQDGGSHAVSESHAPAVGGVDMNAVVRRGSRGETVAAVQARLGLTADGDFGPGTEQALKNWQAANGLTPDGIAGPATLARLLG
jgi:putative chitinase